MVVLTSREATEAQKKYIQYLLRSRVVPNDLREQAHSWPLTDGDCRRLIPLLEALSELGGDWTSPEGYDDSPDMGVHQFDGGGSW